MAAKFEFLIRTSDGMFFFLNSQEFRLNQMTQAVKTKVTLRGSREFGGLALSEAMFLNQDLKRVFS